jgi:uncharacterized protein with PIN domain
VQVQKTVPEKTADFRFVGVLRDFLRDAVSGRMHSYGFSGKPSIKDAIEAQGVPHTEVDRILVDEESVGFDYSLRDGDRVVVHPFSGDSTSQPVVPLREALPREPMFVVDVNLGKLAKWLRLLGFDTEYQNDLTDAEIASIAARELRVVLTRDRRLLHQKIITHGYFVRSNLPEEQITEILDRFQLDGQREPFRRCLECNGRIRAVEKEIVLDQLPPRTRIHYDRFFRCDRCNRVYWKGPHYERLRRKIIQVAR